ncbi:MAG: glycosyltransferase family 2 protein [Nitrospirae bacterium]|nr:glycosyltransferase family 2 protein [Nitrospirota bacterium]
MIFNRPDTTKQVFEAIRKAKPGRLFIAADGPRPDKPGEADACEQTRAIVKQIDWECDVHTLFREKNLGCRVAVSSALSWFFEHVEEGIILEDDCLPDESFFPYCRHLLEKYRHDGRVMHISGDNFQFGRQIGQASYYASQFCHIWGWAGWRRVWQLYHPDMPDYPAFVRDGGLERMFRYPDMRRYYSVIFDRVFRGKLNTWDHQLSYAILKNNGVCIIPNVNLVENIGFTSGTHISFNQFSFFKKLAVQRLYTKLMSNKRQTMTFPLVHPDVLVPSYEADHRYFREIVFFFIMRVYIIFLKHMR